MAWQGQPGPEDAVGGISGVVQLDTSQIDPGLAALRAGLDRAEADLKRLAAASTLVDAGMSRAGGGMQSFAYRMTVVTQLADDIQYGFSAIVNQLPQAAAAFGLGAGLGGGIAIAGVAVNQLIKHWGDLTAAFGMGATLTEAERMKELGKQTSFTADEQDRLNRYKREEKTIADQAARRPKGEGEIGKEVGAAVGELGADELKTQLRRAIAAGMGPVSDAAVQEQMRKEGALGFTPLGAAPGSAAGTREAKARESIRKAREQEVSDAADRLLANAETGPGELGEQARRRIGELLPGPEGDVFRDPLKKPRAKAEDERLKAEATHAREEEEMAAKRRADAKKEEDRRQTDEARHASEEEAMANARRAKDAADMIAGEADQAEENDANYKKRLMEKVRNREPLTEGERAAAPKEVREAEREALRREGDQHERLGERRADLNERLRRIMNPERQGQTLGGDAYAASFHAMTGDSEMVKQQRAANRILEEIRDNERDIKAIGVRKR